MKTPLPLRMLEKTKGITKFKAVLILFSAVILLIVAYSCKNGMNPYDLTDTDPTASSKAPRAVTAGIPAMAVEASSVNGSNSASNISDGSTSTYWQSAAASPQWIKLNFGSRKNFDKIRILWGSSYAKNYALLVSDDNVTWTQIYKSTASAYGWQDILVVNTWAQYVKISCADRAKNWGNQICEVEVINLPGVPADNALGVNLIKSGTLEASSASGGNKAAKSFDGSTATYWQSAAYSPQWLRATTGTFDTHIKRIKIYWGSSYAKNYTIDISVDKVDWITVYTGTCSASGWQIVDMTDHLYYGAFTIYVRINCLDRAQTWGNQICEWQVIGTTQE